MAEFNLIETPPNGVCMGCGTSYDPRGFVDTFGTINVKDEFGGISGICDAIFCATCVEQMGRVVGCASKAEVEAFAYEEMEKDQEMTKLKDEIKAWQERHELLLGNLSDHAAEAFSGKDVLVG